MKIRVSERHTKLRPAVRQSLVEKLEGLERYFDRILSIEAVVEEEKNHFIVRLLAHLVRKKVVKAEAQAPELHGAVNEALDNLKAQLTKFKDQLKDHRPPVRALPSEPEPEGDSRWNHLIRTEVYIRKPMTVEEALLELEETGRDLYLFEDAERGGLRLLFRHPDGQIELIEPKF